MQRGLVTSISPRQVDRFLAQRICDRTKASTRVPRRTNAKPWNNTKPPSSGFDHQLFLLKPGDVFTFQGDIPCSTERLVQMPIQFLVITHSGKGEV